MGVSWRKKYPLWGIFTQVKPEGLSRTWKKYPLLGVFRRKNTPYSRWWRWKIINNLLFIYYFPICFVFYEHKTQYIYLVLCHFNTKHIMKSNLSMKSKDFMDKIKFDFMMLYQQNLFEIEQNCSISSKISIKSQILCDFSTTPHHEIRRISW